jgi:hypothetical protein
MVPGKNVLRIQMINSSNFIQVSIDKIIIISTTIFTIIFILLECWQHEPDDRPNIHQVISELNLINTENEDVSSITPKENGESGETENLCSENLCLPD